jgi:TetR/AcrR family transcriptional repressor of nem operon
MAVMAKVNTKDLLLETGRKVFLERGYNHAGIESILQEAGVPKGSFYNYFESKEDFGLQVIERFAACHDEELDRCLNDPTLDPLARLRSYFQTVIDKLEEGRCRKGCLIGNLSQEMADQSERFRARLEEVLDGWVKRIESCLLEAQNRGAISPTEDIRTLAEFLLNAWQGAILRAKTARSTAPLKIFVRMTLDRIQAV